MAMTVNNLGTLSLLNMLNRTATTQESVMQRMSTGSKINSGADDPAGLLALTKLSSELTSVDAAIGNNQRTDAVLGVADAALSEVGNLIDDVQRLANETANDAGLTAEEVSANQAQIDDALASVDRIISNTNFNGKKLLDGSLAIRSTVGNAGAVTDVRVFSRNSDETAETLTVEVATDAEVASAQSVMTTSATEDTSFSVQGKLGTAMIQLNSGDKLSAALYKINQTTAQTGVSARLSGNALNINSSDKGDDAFVRVKQISGSNVNDVYDDGADAEVSVNGQMTSVDGDTVHYNGNGVGVSFEIGSLGAGSSTTITVQTEGGATFQLGTNSQTRHTLGLDGAYTDQLGTASEGYLASLKSGKDNSLLEDPSKAASIAREARKQISQLQGRIGGFQKFQVRTSINSLNDVKVGLEKAKSVVNDVDYAMESAELNRQNILMQSSMGLLGMANQQSSQVLALLR